jgi:exosortase K
MNGSLAWKHRAQFVAVLLCALLVKFYYSTASVNELRWILAPTAAMVEFISGKSFAFESHTGYMSSDHTFVIAASCAGVNFLITAFVMLSLRRLWRDRAEKISWGFFAAMALVAYFATLLANIVRISTALLLLQMPLEIGLSPNQLHRFEGIFVYFGFLLLLFLVSERFTCGGAKNKERMPSRSLAKANRLERLRGALFPLLIYYAVTLCIPLVNGAYRRGGEFREHALFVLLTPLLLLLLVLVSRFSAAKVSKSMGRISREPS